MSHKKWNVLVTGGAGYVGSALVPKLLLAGHRVTVLDLYLYGDDIFLNHRKNKNLIEIKGDIRDTKTVSKALKGCDSVIHLACISNDPSYDLNPELGKSINFDSFSPLVQAAKNNGIELFIYASSSSVYGIKTEKNVTEDALLQPLTDYSKYKALCEEILQQEQGAGFSTCIIRPSTVCGYAPRLRLDLTVNLLTNLAINNGKITVFGGEQKRPNIHINDMVDLYLFLLQCKNEKINGETFNAGYENYTVMEIAKMVREAIGAHVTIEVTPTSDKRSYHVCSEKMRSKLGFAATRSVIEASRDLALAFKQGKVPEPLTNPRYFNIKLMQNVQLK